MADEETSCVCPWIQNENRRVEVMDQVSFLSRVIIDCVGRFDLFTLLMGCCQFWYLHK